MKQSKSLSTVSFSGGSASSQLVPASTDPNAPLPNPARDVASFDRAKQFVRDRFDQQLLIGPIDYGLTLESLRGQAPINITFDGRNVEQLAQQCASLLERGIATRSEYEALAEKDLDTLTDLAEFLVKDAEAQSDVSLGFFSLDTAASSAELAAANTYVSTAETAPNQIIKDSLKPEADSQKARLPYLRAFSQ